MNAIFASKLYILLCMWNFFIVLPNCILLFGCLLTYITALWVYSLYHNFKPQLLINVNNRCNSTGVHVLLTSYFEWGRPSTHVGTLVERGGGYLRNQMTRIYMILFQFFYPVFCWFGIHCCQSNAPIQHHFIPNCWLLKLPCKHVQLSNWKIFGSLLEFDVRGGLFTVEFWLRGEDAY